MTVRGVEPVAMHVRLTSSHSLTVVGEGCWVTAEGTGRREKGKDGEKGIEGGRRIVIALSCTVTPAVYFTYQTL